MGYPDFVNIARPLVRSTSVICSTFFALYLSASTTLAADKKPVAGYFTESDEIQNDDCCDGLLENPKLDKIPIAKIISEYEKRQSKKASSPPQPPAQLASLPPNDNSGSGVTWERVYNEVLKKNCQECHGSVVDNKFVMRGFVRFDKYATTLASVEPGKPEESRLFRHIKPKDKSIKLMPPEDSGFLSAEQIELVRQWILQGAKGPRVSGVGGRP